MFGRSKRHRLADAADRKVANEKQNGDAGDLGKIGDIGDIGEVGRFLYDDVEGPDDQADGDK